jgi:hypothetical protein
MKSMFIGWKKMMSYLEKKAFWAIVIFGSALFTLVMT